MVVYHVAKVLDTTRGRTGTVGLDELEAIYVGLLGCQKRYARERMALADGIFWILPKRKNAKIAGLVGHQKLVDRLNPNFPASKPCELSIRILLDRPQGTKASTHIKAVLLAVLASRNGQREPISIERLAAYIDHSERQVHRWIKGFELLEVGRNYVPLSDHPSKREADRAWATKGFDPRYEIQLWKDAWSLVLKMPNDYFVSEFRWLAWRWRKRPLREWYSAPEPYEKSAPKEMIPSLSGDNARFWKSISPRT
jgi:hypothetical protein